MSPRHRCALMVVVFAAGCTMWRPLPGAGLARTGSEPLDYARVILRDGNDVELEDATISPDSIIGFGAYTRKRFAVARSEVTRLEAWRPDAQKTVIAGAVSALSVLAVLYLTALALLSGEGT